MGISVIKKRDGRIVPFDVQKITEAIEKSFRATEPERENYELSTSLALEVYTLLELEDDPAPTVEHVQDLVEQVLMREGYSQTAKNYILYREARSRARQGVLSPARREAPASVEVSDLLRGQALTEDVRRLAASILDGTCPTQVPALDTLLAPAVTAQYGVCYRRSLHRTLELLAGRLVAESALQYYADTIAAGGTAAELPLSAAYLEREADLICGTVGCDRDTVQSAQRHAAAYALQDIQRIGEHAMSQFLFSLNAPGCAYVVSVHYGADLSPAGRLVTRSLLLASSQSPEQKPLSHPVQVFHALSGVSREPDDPNYDLYQLARQCAAIWLVPDFSFQPAP